MLKVCHNHIHTTATTIYKYIYIYRSSNSVRELLCWNAGILRTPEGPDALNSLRWNLKARDEKSPYLVDSPAEDPDPSIM